MKTGLYEKHLSLGAKIVDFCGWEMPIQYAGIIQEHCNVRQNVGIFDVSHMGRIQVQGKDAERFLDRLSTNKIKGKPDGSATYTVWGMPHGGCVDDLIVYKESAEKFFVVANAGNRQKDLQHLLNESKSFDVCIQDCFSDGILAIQGPKADPLLKELFPQAIQLKPMHFMTLEADGKKIIISRTGYTGAGGFEIFASKDETIKLWDRLLQEGQAYGIQPIGLGARDTLRLEMGYALYGHEINEEISPNESVSRWTIKWDKGDFIGKSAMEQIEQNHTKRSEYGVILIEKGIAREGYEVLQEGKRIGKVTSGTFSPILNKSIAIILVNKPLKEGDFIDVQIRQNLVKAEVVKLPFLK